MPYSPESFSKDLVSSFISTGDLDSFLRGYSSAVLLYGKNSPKHKLLEFRASIKKDLEASGFDFSFLGVLS